MPTGYLVGAFDVIDVRDLDVINQLHDSGYRVVIGVLPDLDLAHLHGRGPLIPLDERVELVGHLRHVHASIPHAGSAVSSREDWTTFAVEGDPLPSRIESPTLVTPRCESRSGVRRLSGSGSISRAVA